jgi:hypothetical protein
MISSKIFARRNWPWLAIAATMVLMVVQLRAQGRLWFCECGNLRFWISDPNGPHTSQHLADPYTFTHFQHGLGFFWAVRFVFKRWKWQWQLWLALTIEATWEVVENTEWVINRYRDATAALGYTGDTILNSFGDLLACFFGIYVAYRIGWRLTWILFFAIELLLIVTIRDSLLLNILMLFYPIQAIKDWQTRG